jgi:hypothetical protein
MVIPPQAGRQQTDLASLAVSQLVIKVVHTISS